MSKKEMTLTSVKVQSELFEEFKISCVNTNFPYKNLLIVQFICILLMKILERKFTTTQI